MTKKAKVLVTGGAGFIGSFLVDELVKQGHNVLIYDNLEEQVHHGQRPKYLNPKAKFIKGDINNQSLLKKALLGQDFVFHLASAVGVGQSQYQIRKYSETNVAGTANLMDIIVNEKMPIKKIIFASSMTIYGEGLYLCKRHGKLRPGLRSESQLRRKIWEMQCPHCTKSLKAISISENDIPSLSSVYAFSKLAAENLLLTVGRTYRIPVVVLRIFSAYGPRQSLSNPYTGVAAIFLSRIKNGHRPIVYEDGQQSRDFVSVHDVVDAFISAMKQGSADYEIFNVGSGKATSIGKLSFELICLSKSNLKTQINGAWRKNDIRHCTADTTKIKKRLGWHPKVTIEKGLLELVQWAQNEPSFDSFGRAAKELTQKGLLK